MVHGQQRTAFDASGAVAQHPVKGLAKFGDHAGNAFAGQRVLVPGLGRRKQHQIVQPLVADQRLGELCVALDHIDQIEHHTAFGAHDEIEVAQPHVEINDDHAFATLREGCAEGGGGGGFANTSLA